jgi:polyamine oxidase
MGRKPLRYDCIIVGAGISGLSCAKEISAAGLMVLLLESSTRIGGRLNTIDLGGNSATPADIGASFVHGIIDNPLTKLSKEVPFKLHLPTEQTTTRVYPHDAHGEPLKEEVSEKLDFLSFNVTFNRCHEQAQAGPSVPKEEESVWDVLTSTPAGQGVWRDIEEEDRERVLSLSPMWSGWTGAKLSDVSLKWWGFENEFRGEDAVVSNGYRQLIDWTLHQAQRQGAELICDSKVTKISRQGDDGPFSVFAASSDGGEVEFEADHVVCSVSLGGLASILA